MFLVAHTQDKVLHVAYDNISHEMFVSDSVHLAAPVTVLGQDKFVFGYQEAILQLNDSQCLVIESIVTDDSKEETYKVSLCTKEAQMQQHVLKLVTIHTPCNYLEQLYHDGIVFTDFKLDQECLRWAHEFVHGSTDIRLHCIEKYWQMMKCIGDKQITSFVKAVYYGKRCHLSTYSSIHLRKEHPQEGWHVDWPYHTMHEPFPMETLGLQCMILLDDFTEENGATYFVRGSHTTRKHVRGGYANERLLAKKGTVVFWLAKLWHCGGKNTTDNGRTALLANFSPEHVPAKHNMTSNICNGNFGFVPKEGKCFLI